MCATAPVRDYVVNCAARRVWRATARYGEAGTKWRSRLVPRTPLGRTVPAGAVKHALYGSTGSLVSLRNLLGLLADCWLPAAGVGAAAHFGPYDNIGYVLTLHISPHT